MISRVTWLEKHDAQLDAAALRRDISEAQAHITRLHRRYLGGDVQASQPRSPGPLSAAEGLCRDLGSKFGKLVFPPGI
jgi:hypothetical protein